MYKKFLILAPMLMMLSGCSQEAIVTLEEVVEATTIEETVAIEETTVDIYELKALEMKEALLQLETISDTKDWFIAYKEVINQYSEWVDLPTSVYDLYTEEEIRYMAKCVETETYQCPFEARVNVANVILNRVASPRWSNDVITVITSPHQFAYGRDNITEESILAVEYAVMFGDTTNGALFFNSYKEVRDTFCGASYMFTDVAGHHFYK